MSSGVPFHVSIDFSPTLLGPCCRRCQDCDSSRCLAQMGLSVFVKRGPVRTWRRTFWELSTFGALLCLVSPTLSPNKCFVAVLRYEVLETKALEISINSKLYHLEDYLEWCKGNRGRIH